MSTTTTIRPSDLGYIRWNAEGTVATWRWNYPGVCWDIVQRPGVGMNGCGDGTSITGSMSFRARLTVADPEGAPFGRTTLTTCGHMGKGGTRHREFDTVGEAIAGLLAWLDRRYAAKPREEFSPEG